MTTTLQAALTAYAEEPSPAIRRTLDAIAQASGGATTEAAMPPDVMARVKATVTDAEFAAAQDFVAHREAALKVLNMLVKEATDVASLRERLDQVAGIADDAMVFSLSAYRAAVAPAFAVQRDAQRKITAISPTRGRS